MRFMFTIEAVVCLLAPAAPAQQVYSDPQGRFHVAVPAGWMAESAGEGGARLWSGSASCHLLWMESAEDARALVAQVLGQAGAQWRNFQVVSSGEAALGALRGQKAVAVGTNPAGEGGVFLATVAGEGNQRIGLICSLPQAAFAGLKDALATVEHGVGLGPTGGLRAPADFQEKLDALEAACRAFVLTPQECEARRRLLLQKGSGGPTPAMAVAAPPAGRGTLGIEFRDLTEAEARSMGMQRRAGVWIARAVPGSPAQQAGMGEGDVLLLIDRQLIQSADDVVRLMSAKKPGDAVEVGWFSRGQARTASIRLAAMVPPAQRSTAQAPSQSAAVHPQEGPAVSASKPGTVKLIRHAVRDPGADNIEAYSFLIPAGWRTEGGIQWFPQYRILANLLMRIIDPQTGAAIEFLPVQYFFYWQVLRPRPNGSNYLGRVLWPPIQDVGEFVETMYMGGPLARLRKATKAAVQEMPELAALAVRGESASQAKSGKIRYEYEQDGQAWEEDVYVTLVYTFVADIAMWRSDRAYSFRAPKGMLDRLTPLMAAVVSTARISLDWFAQYSIAGQLFDERMRQGIRGAAALSQTIRRNSEEIRQMFEQSYRERTAADDRIHQRFTEYIRGVETYRNPFEDRPVQLPSGYSNVWVNRNGEYILSNEANFNPNIGSNLDWRPLKRAQ
ncbi:MAG: hypothetical protein KatS3mg005_2091 [Bryobacteraceae bacterium]|nr:MAG: hypothetical protein KatS3mg005_2091 [Bryobacteraceae bacterium]